MTSGEHYQIKIYRNNNLVYQDSEQVISFSVEQTITTEKASARLRLDGENVSSFKVRENDAIEIYISSGGTPRKVFAGLITDVSRVQEDSLPYIDITASDWGELLSGRKINQSYPIVVSASTIVKGIVNDIISLTTPGPNDRRISVNNVEEVGKTRTVDFVGLSMFEALQKLTEYTQCDFYVDVDKDLNWFQRGSRTSSKTLTSDDLSTYEYVKDTDVVNWARVFGAPNRTEPDYDLDAWSDTLEDWYSLASGGSSTLVIQGLITTFSAQGNWTRNRASMDYKQTLPVSYWTLIALPWDSGGASPWLDTDDAINYISVDSADLTGSTVSKWGFPDLDTTTYVTNIKDWKTLSVCFKGKYDIQYGIPVFTPTFPDTYLDYWTGHWGEASAVLSPSRMVFIQNTDSTGGQVWQTLDDETGNLFTSFNLRVVAASYFTDGDELCVLKIDNSSHASTPMLEVWLKRGTSGGVACWYFRLKGYDKNGELYVVSTNTIVPDWSWTFYNVELKGAGSSTAQAYLYTSTPTIIAQKLNIDLSGRRCNRIFFEAMFSCPYRIAPNGFEFKDIAVYATKKTITLNVYFYKRSYGDWYPSPFALTFQDYELTYVVKTLDITSESGVVYLDASDAKLEVDAIEIRLTLDSFAGITNAGGGVILTYAYLSTDIDLYYGGGSPYISDDDNDEDYVETSTSGAEEFWWGGFGLDCSKMASFQSAFIIVKGKLLSSGYAYLTAEILDATSSYKIELVPELFNSTAYVTHTISASSYFSSLAPLSRQIYNLENLKIGFKFTAGTATGIRISYAYIVVTFFSEASLMEIDPNVKKSGTYSIKTYWAGEEGEGTLTSQMVKTLPEEIVCQTLDRKEGFISLAFAALVDMSVVSDLDHWKCPDAKLDIFTVILEDSNTIQLKYSANDLYPESTYSATPRPEATTMKEVHVPVGEDSEANGMWEHVITGSTFDWTSVKKIYFSVTGTTETSIEGNPYLSYIEFWIDWLHFEKGKWYADYQLSDQDYSVTQWGRSYQEVFDDSCFSQEDCYSRAKMYVETYKYPRDYLTGVEIDYLGMEDLNPGEIVDFILPEGNLSMRITKITWDWDGSLWGQLDLDTEGLPPVLEILLEETTDLGDSISQLAPPSSEKIINGDFETGDFTGWSPVSGALIKTDQKHDGGTYSAWLGNGCNAYIEQTLDVPEAVVDIDSFGLWLYVASDGSVPVVWIIYTDNSITQINTLVYTTDAWRYNDLKSYLQAGKIVKKILILMIRDSYWNTYVDDVSLMGH